MPILWNVKKLIASGNGKFKILKLVENTILIFCIIKSAYLKIAKIKILIKIANISIFFLFILLRFIFK